MLRFLTQLWRWLKGWFVRRSTTVATVSSSRPVLSDLEYENALMALLEEAAKGKSWGNLQGLLISHNLSPQTLAQWLREYGARWLEQPEQHQELACRLLSLAQIANGDLAIVARSIGTQIQAQGTPPLPSGSSPAIKTSAAIEEPGEELLEETGVTVKDLWQRGGTHMQDGNHEAALANFEQALKYEPEHVQILCNRGGALYCLGRFEEALTSCEQALQLQPDYSSAWLNRGSVLSRLSRYEEAIASYEQVIKLKPDDSSAWLYRGSLLCSQLGRYDEALISCEQALKYKPDGSRAWFLRGSALSHLNRNEEALASYEQALKHKPDYSSAWINRGTVLDELSRHEEALSSYEQALKLQPDNSIAWGERGRLLMKLGRYDEALSCCEQGLKLQPDDPMAWNNYGTGLKDLGRFEEAIASYEQALKLQPDESRFWFNRGNAALNSSHYNPSYQQQLAQHFSFSCARISQSIQFTPLSAAEAQALLQSTWQTSQQLLLETFSPQQVPEALLERIHLPLPPTLAELLQRSPPPAMWELLRQPPSEEVLERIHQDSLQHPSLFNPQLQQRGYRGALASYQAELDKAIRRDTHPEGWGFLHHQIGRAHVRQARRVTSPNSLWRQAEQSFKTALQVLQPPQFEELHLEVLQDLVRVLIYLQQTAEATELQRRGTDLLKRLLNDPQRSARQRQQLALKFAGFEQLTVNLALQQGDITGALSLAETSKNTCLRWLLETEAVPTLHYKDMQSLCADPATALVYWHLSPLALITFLLLPGSEAPILIPPPGNLPTGYKRSPESSCQADDRSISLKQLLAWETWLSQWNQDYADYSSSKKGSNAPSDWKKTHPWRISMVQRLADLKVILNGSEIDQLLAERGIKQIILIPHRDLHRFPLHHLFDAYSCTYFPSAHLALTHYQRRSPTIPLNSMLLVENPKSTPQRKKGKQALEPLPFAETESALIQQCIGAAVVDRRPVVRIIGSQDATLATVTTALEQPHQVFHFTGHGAYDSRNPLQSCLFLAGGDRLTLSAIVQLDLSSYHLVCLAACETAVTGDQTITTEYVGLMSAFLKAGAGHVLSTLWRVESVTSMIVMVQFYRELQHQPPAAALRATQTFLRNRTREQLTNWLTEVIALLSKNSANRSFCILLTAERDRLQSLNEEYPYAHPYYWAAFHIAGAI